MDFLDILPFRTYKPESATDGPEAVHKREAKVNAAVPYLQEVLRATTPGLEVTVEQPATAPAEVPVSVNPEIDGRALEMADTNQQQEETEQDTELNQQEQRAAEARKLANDARQHPPEEIPWYEKAAA